MSNPVSELIDYAEEEYGIERSETAREKGRRFAHLRD